MITSSISITINNVTENIHEQMTEECCQRVAKEFEKLNQANNELREFFGTKSTDLNLGMEITRIRNKINSIISSLHGDFNIACRKNDYEAMGINDYFFTIIHSEFKSYLTRDNSNAANFIEHKYQNALNNSVPKAMKQFFDEGFKNRESKFLFMLLTLRRASECNRPNLKVLSELYMKTRKLLTDQINDTFEAINLELSKTNCYDDAIDIMSTLNRSLSSELKEHIIAAELSFDSVSLLEEWQKKKQKIDRDMELDGADAEGKLKQWQNLLNQINPNSNYFWRKYRQWSEKTTYERKISEIRTKISEVNASGKKALNRSNYIQLRENIYILDLIEKYLKHHVSGAGEYSETLKKRAKETFLELCQGAQGVLQSKKKQQFEGMFFDYRGLILDVPCVIESKECRKAFSLTNQLIHDALESDLKDINMLLDDFEYNALKSKIVKARKFGDFIADKFALLLEEMKSCDHIHVEKMEPWLVKISTYCQEHFAFGRCFSNIKYFGILKLSPSADKNAIKKAYKKLAKQYHPDKTRSNDSEMFRRIKEAYEVLLNAEVQESERPFSGLIRIRSNLRIKMKTYLDEQRYELVEKVLFKIGDLKTLKTLVTPNLDTEEISEEIYELVRSHVQQVKINVESNWSSKNYRALNDTITDLRSMEDSFKSYNNIFPSSWDEGGIVRKVEQEIEELGLRAREHLSSESSAKKHRDDFRRCFLNMGHVLVELPLFKDFTKAIMSSVLEVCLGYDWGYGFLFEFGLGLQRGDKNDSEEDSNVAQTLVAEFSHFKEVLTMVWNEETSQKPAEDTIDGIKGQRYISGVLNDVPIERSELLQSFSVFDAEYKKLLGEYIEPESDLKKLVHKTTALATKLGPMNASSGWNGKVKKQIPHILAAVFTAFTVLKSGASYNRLTETSGGDMKQKLLMKPHNIQVTLFHIF